MSFSKRKPDRRKPDVRLLAASAEVCETRALLSADGAAVTIDEIIDSKVDDENVVDVESGDDEFVPEIAICTMLPPEVFVSDVEGEVIEGEVIEGEVIEGEELLWTCDLSVDEEFTDVEVVDPLLGEEEFVDITTLEDWDPSWAYRSFVVEDGEVADGESEVIIDEEIVVDEEEIVDITTLGEWDPSWAYFSFSVVDGVVGEDSEVISDEEIAVGEEEFVDITTLEDWDPSWAYRGGVAHDFSTTDEFESTDEEPFDGEVIYTMGVLEKDVEDSEEFVLDGEVAEYDSEESFETTDVDVEDVVVTDDQEVTDDALDGEFISDDELNDLIRYNIAPNFRGNVGTGVIMSSAAGGGLSESPEATVNAVMGPVASGGPVAVPVSVPVINVPVAVQGTAVPSVPASIPVAFSSFQPLFEAEQELGTIGTLIAHLPEDSSVSSELSEVVVDSGLESGLSPTPSDSSSLDSGLEVLDTLLEDGSTESESETPSEPTEVEVTPEETVTSSNEATVPEQVVVTSAQSVRYSSERLTDRFMTEFAVSGFVG